VQFFGTRPAHAGTHNISKIQLKIKYGFCRITDLGISYFNFPSKNCSSKVYTCFGKVVVLVTKSTTKLGLQFLQFSKTLYDFSKLQLKHIKGEDSILHKGPGNFLKFTTVPSAFNAQTPTRLQPSHPCPQRRGRACRRRGRARAGKQVAQGSDWSHP
jgi:hypothetical protein